MLSVLLHNHQVTHTSTTTTSRSDFFPVTSLNRATLHQLRSAALNKEWETEQEQEPVTHPDFVLDLLRGGGRNPLLLQGVHGRVTLCVPEQVERCSHAKRQDGKTSAAEQKRQNTRQDARMGEGQCRHLERLYIRPSNIRRTSLECVSTRFLPAIFSTDLNMHSTANADKL